MAGTEEVGAQREDGGEYEEADHGGLDVAQHSTLLILVIVLVFVLFLKFLLVRVLSPSARTINRSQPKLKMNSPGLLSKHFVFL